MFIQPLLCTRWWILHWGCCGQPTQMSFGVFMLWWRQSLNQLSHKSMQNYDCEKPSEGEAHSVVRPSLWGVDWIDPDLQDKWELLRQRRKGRSLSAEGAVGLKALWREEAWWGCRTQGWFVCLKCVDEVCLGQAEVGEWSQYHTKQDHEAVLKNFVLILKAKRCQDHTSISKKSSYEKG